MQGQGLRSNVLVVAAAKRRSAKPLLLQLKYSGRAEAVGVLTPMSWVRMSFENPHVSARALAHMFGVSKDSVRRAQRMMAVIVFNRQLQSLRACERMAADVESPLFCVGWSLRWGETTKRLTLPLHPGLGEGVSSHHWHVCVCRCPVYRFHGVMVKQA